MSTIKDTDINKYIEDVCSYVKNKRVHKLIEVELLCHFDDIIESCLEKGMSKEDGIKQALTKMGPSNIVGADLDKAHKTNSDWVLIFMTSALVLFGLFTLSFIQKNSPSTRLYANSNLVLKSAFYLLISIAISLIFIKIDFRVIKKYSFHIYFVSIALTILTVFMSPQVNGARGWIVLGNISFNILTFSTLSLIISLAGIFNDYNWQDKKQLFKGIILVIAPSLFFIMTPDLAAAIIYLIAAISIMILSGFKIKYLIISMVGLGAMFSAYIFSAAYRIERFFAFLNPSIQPDSAGYIYNQLTNLKNSAGILGQSDNLALTVLPEAHTDFVLSSIIYSFGWLAAIILIAVVLSFIIRIAFIGSKTKDSYGKLLVCGICTLFSIQFLLSILSNLSLSPILNVSMPFISYGGSQLLINILSISIINNVYKQRNTPLISTF